MLTYEKYEQLQERGLELAELKHNKDYSNYAFGGLELGFPDESKGPVFELTYEKWFRHEVETFEINLTNEQVFMTEEEWKKFIQDLKDKQEKEKREKEEKEQKALEAKQEAEKLIREKREVLEWERLNEKFSHLTAYQRDRIKRRKI